MRVCRVKVKGQPRAAFYDEKFVTPVAAVVAAHAKASGTQLDLPLGDSLLDLLPGGSAFAAARQVAEWLASHEGSLGDDVRIAADQAELLVPIPRPNKIFLLAGNYAEHIREGGGVAAERAETFPYVFMKPPTTTLTDPGKPVCIPAVSPDHIDWELELAVVIGRGGKGIKEADALSHVAGYMVLNDISNRKFRPNPDRKQRDKDSFFDWLHGKWHDSFCPCGPCIASADAIADPQALPMKLTLNGNVMQNASTGQMIFPVAAIIEFISSFVTLEPGDIISTGTPSGVGSSTGTFLKPGDRLEASIGSIGTVVSPVAAE